jgi:hypothetical protein
MDGLPADMIEPEKLVLRVKVLFLLDISLFSSFWGAHCEKAPATFAFAAAALGRLLPLRRGWNVLKAGAFCDAAANPTEWQQNNPKSQERGYRRKGDILC